MPDLHLSADRASESEQAAVDGALTALGISPAVVVETDRLVRGGVKAKNERRHGLLPALHALQTEAGWISPGGVNYIADRLGVPPAEGYGVASFYELFEVDSEPAEPQDVVHVCVDSPCLEFSAAKIVELEAASKSVHASPCLGQCERATSYHGPALFIQGHQKADSVPSDKPEELWDLPQKGQPGITLLANVGSIDPTSIEAYVAVGGYKALAQAFALGAEGVVAKISDADLMGRGGAAFPTGVKWAAVAAESGQKYVVANADESEPGTFKDRTVMEHDPFAVIEALTIAGFATGASKGWIYIRGEYPLATARLIGAVEAARNAGYLGQEIAGSSFEFDIEIRRGAGAYICGEETALFNSLEGFRGEPRQKPPFPTTNGLFGQPTAVNNPETLLNVLSILTGGDANQKLFCLSGHVARPGTYEVTLGPTLGEILELAGGVSGELKAVLLGGAAGSFVGPDSLDMPLTTEATRAEGLSLGSGVIMAFNAETDFGAVLERIAEFFRKESCGQCVPCRVGALRQHELVTSSTSGKRIDLALLNDIDQVMKDASICGLGHTATTAVKSAIELGLIS